MVSIEQLLSFIIIWSNIHLRIVDRSTFFRKSSILKMCGQNFQNPIKLLKEAFNTNSFILFLFRIMKALFRSSFSFIHLRTLLCNLMSSWLSQFILIFDMNVYIRMARTWAQPINITYCNEPYMLCNDYVDICLLMRNWAYMDVQNNIYTRDFVHICKHHSDLLSLYMHAPLFCRSKHHLTSSLI